MFIAPSPKRPVSSNRAESQAKSVAASVPECYYFDSFLRPYHKGYRHFLCFKCGAGQCSVGRLMGQIKTMDFGSGQGANHSDTRGYRADLQRRHGAKDAFLCSR
jgi:hypothetical protein